MKAIEIAIISELNKRVSTIFQQFSLYLFGRKEMTET